MKFRPCVLGIIFLFTILFFSVSCSFKRPEIKELSQLTIENISQDTLYLSLLINVYNPNSYSITLEKINAEIVHEESVIGTTSLKRELLIPADQENEMDILVGLFMPKMLQDFESMLHADSTRIMVAGDFTGSKWIFSKTVHDTCVIVVNMKEKLKEFMNNQSGDMISLAGIEAVTVRPEQTMMQITMRFDNALPFEYSVDSLFMTVHISQEHDTVAVVSSKNQVLIHPKKSVDISLLSVFRHVDMLKGMGNVIVGGKRDYLFSGDVWLTVMGVSIQLPLEFEKPIIPNIPKPF